MDAPPSPQIPPRPDLPRVVPPPPSVAPRRRGRRVAAFVVALVVAVGAVGLAARPGGERSTRADRHHRSSDPSTSASPYDGPTGPHSFLHTRADDTPVRWNPCEPIHYQLDLHGAPAGAVGVMVQVAARLHQATGIELVYDGTSDATLRARTAFGFTYQRADGSAAFYPVLVVWAPADQIAAVGAGHEHRLLGLAMPSLGVGTRSGTYVSGVIAVVRAKHLPPNFSQRYALGPVLLHEWGHILGLGHTSHGPEELMYNGDMPLNETSFGPGDLQGLAALGLGGGCLAPREVTASPTLTLTPAASPTLTPTAGPAP